MAKSRDELRMTVAEFLAWDDGTDTRYELIDGRPVAMAPPSPSHSIIAGNAYAALRSRLPSGCLAGVEFGVSSVRRRATFFQTDVAVVCGTAADRRDRPLPTLIVEILSPSDRRLQRDRKLDDYRMIDTVQQILFVDSTRRWVQSWRRAGDGSWNVRDFVGTSAVPTCLDGEPIPLDELYAGVELPPEGDEDGQDQPTR